MDVTKLKKEIKETIFPNGEKKIKGQKHQDMLFGLVDEIDRSDGLMRADIALNQEMAMENRGNINDLRGETAEKFGKVDASISNINIRETETSKELDNIKNALRDVTSGKDNGQITGGKVINIPTQATNSVAGYKIEGLTATQLVQNGDFKDGTKGWFTEGTISIAAKEGYLAVSKQDIERTPRIEQRLELVRGHIHYSIATLEPVNSDIDIRVAVADGSEQTPKKNAKKGIRETFGFLSKIGIGSMFRFFLYFANTTDVVKVYNLCTINLTDIFGAGNEPTKEWCDEHFPEYFNGAKSVKTPLRLSCGDSKMFINSELELKKGDVIKDGVLNGKKLNTSGTLVTKANSKVVVDYAKNATLLYNKGLKIYDIKTLEVLQKFEEDGSITSLDVAKATYTNKVLTHPDLKDSDVCYVEYIYSDGIYGNNTITYGINKFITNAPLISPDGRKWRKIEVATNDGILTTKLEEVK